MIVLIRSGGMGNQIFQYFGGHRVTEGSERLVLYGFDALTSAFSGVQATLFRRRERLEAALVRLLRDRGVGRATLPAVKNSAPQRAVLHRLGLQNATQALGVTFGGMSEDAIGIPARNARTAIVVSSGIYCENSRNIDVNLLEKLSFRAPVLLRANALLRDNGLAGRPYAFVHVRLGDLRHLAPTAKWIRAAIHYLRCSRPKIPVIVLSNDLDCVKAMGDLGEDVRLMGADAGTDLALMSMAEAGVITVGTFGWWGARLASERGRGPFIGPESTYGRVPDRWSALGDGMRLQVL